MSAQGLLVLADGTTFSGHPYGATGQCLGQVVFNTAMTGYQEILTDPANRGQIMVMTAVHIGVVGLNDEDGQSDRIEVAGLVLRDPARRWSNWRGQRSLEGDLVAQGVVGLAGVDTRAVTLHLRGRGATRAGIFSGSGLVDAQGRARPVEELLAIVQAAP